MTRDWLPVLVPGRDREPTSCGHCGSASLDREPPLGHHRYGRIVCRTCSRELAWTDTPLVAARPRITPTNQTYHRTPTAHDGAPLRGTTALRGGSDESTRSTSGGISVVERPLVRVRFARGAGCSPACSALYGHDAATHEQRGYARAFDELVPPPAGVVRTGTLLIDLDERRCAVDGRAVELSLGEFTLLAVLADRLGRVCRFGELVARVWGPDELALRLAGKHELRWHLLRVTVRRLRGRLGPDAGWLIENVREHGYRLRAEPLVEDL